MNEDVRAVKDTELEHTTHERAHQGEINQVFFREFLKITCQNVSSKLFNARSSRSKQC